jgi:HK97 gp10 family phage protein
MAATRRDLHGLAELKTALEALGVEVATKTGVAANRRAAKRLLDRLVAVAPEGDRQSPASKTYGRLRVNLRLRRVRGRTQGRIKHQVSTGNAFWGMFYELGTAKQRPRPWFRPAVDSLSGELANIQIEELSRGIDRAARRLAKRAKG